MGTTAHVIVTGPDALADELADDAHVVLDGLEARWSRFRDTSEVSRLNAAAGARVAVSPETFELIERGVEGWRRTDGRFDPTVLDAVVGAGYDRSFELLDPSAHPATISARPAPGCAGIELDPVVRAVRLPVGVGFDPGGIGKGLAADRVVESLRARGATGACVNVGGDVRVDGEAPGGGGWGIAVDHPITRGTLVTLHLAAGAVVSTWRTKRAWGAADDARHHLIDPATGAPSWSGLSGVVVTAAHAWWAEVLAKAAFVAGPIEGARVLEAHGAAGFLVDDDGTAIPVGAVEQFVA